jgi:hypothetical protein
MRFSGTLFFRCRCGFIDFKAGTNAQTPLAGTSGAHAARQPSGGNLKPSEFQA